MVGRRLHVIIPSDRDGFVVAAGLLVEDPDEYIDRIARHGVVDRPGRLEALGDEGGRHPCEVSAGLWIDVWDECSEDDEEKLQVKRVERDDESLQRLQIMFTNRKERSERGRRD